MSILDNVDNFVKRKRLEANQKKYALLFMRSLRESDLEQFYELLTKWIFNFEGSFLNPIVLDFLQELSLTEEETKEIISRQSDLQNNPKEPTGEELLITALEKLREEKPNWKLSDLSRFVESRGKRIFSRREDYSTEDIEDGAKWYSEALKNIEAENSNKKLPHKKVYVSFKLWDEFMAKKFGEPRPKFAAKYKRAVTRRASELRAKRNAGAKPSEK